MTATVAVVKMNGDYASALRRAVHLIGGIDPLNRPERDVTLKVGVFDPRSRHHTAPEAVRAIIDLFDQAPCIRLVESDNYCGKALDRLAACYGELFSERVTPVSLSDDPLARVTPVADEAMPLSHVLFKPNVFVTTHILRSFQMGSVLKNLFGCTPTWQKARYHKKAVFARHMAEICEAAGGLDLAVMDGRYLYNMAAEQRVETDVLLVGRDAAAVEAIGATIAGIKLDKIAVLQEFARRGLGEADPANIAVVGVTPEELAELRQAPKALKKLVAAAPKKLGLSKGIDLLVSEGWMDTYRSVPEVAEALKARGVENPRQDLVATTLRRRLSKTLELSKDGKTSLYRRKPE